ncbi:MAG: hypothetical protein FWJ93_09555 [Micromonosporaceae bacterium]
MALKWAGILVAVVSMTATVTANVVATAGTGIPDAVNVAGIATAATATVVAVAAHCYLRVEAKLERLHELMVTRFDRLDTEIGDRNSGFVEGYLISHPPQGSVVPLAPRGKRAAGGDDD